MFSSTNKNGTFSLHGGMTGMPTDGHDYPMTINRWYKVGFYDQIGFYVRSVTKWSNKRFVGATPPCTCNGGREMQ